MSWTRAPKTRDGNDGEQHDHGDPGPREVKPREFNLHLAEPLLEGVLEEVRLEKAEVVVCEKLNHHVKRETNYVLTVREISKADR